MKKPNIGNYYVSFNKLLQINEKKNWKKNSAVLFTNLHLKLFGLGSKFLAPFD